MQSWKLEARSWKLEAGSWKLRSSPSLQRKAGSWKLETGNWKLVTTRLERKPRGDLDPPCAVGLAVQPSHSGGVGQSTGHVIKRRGRVRSRPLVVVERVVGLEAQLQTLGPAHRDGLERREIDVPVARSEVFVAGRVPQFELVGRRLDAIDVELPFECAVAARQVGVADHVWPAARRVDATRAREDAGRHGGVVVVQRLIGAAGNRRDTGDLPVVENRLGQDVVVLVAEVRYFVRVVDDQHVRTSSGIRVSALVVVALLHVPLIERVDRRQVLAEELLAVSGAHRESVG